MGTVLIVDDEAVLRELIAEKLKKAGFSTLEAGDGETGVAICSSQSPDAVLLDIHMPGMDGYETMRHIKKIAPHVPVVILTGFGDVPKAVEFLKSGAYDFILKPPDYDRLIITLKRAVEKLQLENEVSRAHSALSLSLEHVFGRSAAIKSVITQITQVAQTNFSVIIQGETGTGKSVVASTLRDMSKRSEKPFVNVDIGLIPDDIVESELFGYRRGAFTGAVRDKVGYFEAADRGTIFIDELENMSSHVQSKLLSVIENRKIYPLGSTVPVDIDVRIISATNTDIRSRVQGRQFREDLFYRLGEFIITMPPLRERSEDIPFFARKFIFEASVELNKQIKEIADGTMALLTKHQWPGNIRELKNVMRRAVLFATDGVISPECINFLVTGQEQVMSPAVDQSLKAELRQLECQRIAEALKKTGGNKKKAAALLQISYKNLFDKIRDCGIA